MPRKRKDAQNMRELGKPFANTVLDWRMPDTIMLDM